ncbi:hypothetical protein ACFX13_046437 [Malus domestica]
MGCNVIWRVKARMTKRARPSGSKFIRHHAAIITIQVIKSTPSTSKIIRHPAAIITNQVIKNSRLDLRCSKTSGFMHQHLAPSVGINTKSYVGSLSIFHLTIVKPHHDLLRESASKTQITIPVSEWVNKATWQFRPRKEVAQAVISPATFLPFILLLLITPAPSSTRPMTPPTPLCPSPSSYHIIRIVDPNDLVEGTVQKAKMLHVHLKHLSPLNSVVAAAAKTTNPDRATSPSTVVSSIAKPSQNITVDHHPKDDDKKIRGTLVLMKKNFLELNDLKVSLQLISSVNCDPVLVVVQQRLVMLFSTEEHDQPTQFQLENQQKTQQMPLVIVKILIKKQKNRSGKGVHAGG